MATGEMVGFVICPPKNPVVGGIVFDEGMVPI
jgi:hypothetical protein